MRENTWQAECAVMCLNVSVLRFYFFPLLHCGRWSRFQIVCAHVLTLAVAARSHRKAVNERNSIHTSNTSTRVVRIRSMGTMLKRVSKQQYKICTQCGKFAMWEVNIYIYTLWSQWNRKWFVSCDDKIGNRKLECGLYHIGWWHTVLPLWPLCHYYLRQWCCYVFMVLEQNYRN